MNASSAATGRERLRLNWRKCARDAWCGFATAVLPDAPASGILLVWSQGSNQMIYIGQGGIAKALKWARQFEPISTRPDLLVTWANVPEASQDGVRNYLSDALQPIFRERPSSNASIPVNLPWEEAPAVETV